MIDKNNKYFVLKILQNKTEICQRVVRVLSLINRTLIRIDDL